MKFLKNRFKSSLLYNVGKNLSLMLSKSDIKKIFFVICSQILIGVFDLAAVAAFGALGALTVTGIQSKKPGNRVSYLLETLNLNNLAFQQQVISLAVLAAILMLARTIISIIFIKKSLNFLSIRAADKSKQIISKFFNLRLTNIRNYGSYQTIYSLTTGIWTFMLDVIGAGILIIADLSILMILFLGIFLIDPFIAIVTLILFSSIATTLYLSSHVKARRIGTMKGMIEVKTNESIVNLIETFREAKIRNKRKYFVDEISKIRFNLAKIEAESSFLPFIGKYILESSVIIAILFIAGIQFARKDSVNAVATLTIFMAAASRIAPALLRIQQSAILIKGRLAQSQPSLELVKKLENVLELPFFSNKLDISHSGFDNELSIENLEVRHDADSNFKITNINLRVTSGEYVAIVGKSGSGKTTLVDSILGLVDNVSGRIEISGKDIDKCLEKWPGAIGYVPQEVSIFNGTIRENIVFGYQKNDYSDEYLHGILVKANLDEFINSLNLGIETEVGERGTRLSGGQRQRIGIARALFTNPKILIMDEATSSLDAETEEVISKSINELKGGTTLIVIAHRLSSVRSADRIIYLQDGKIHSEGTFEQVRKQVPDFEKQASLMGL